jgi:hypothetical protein
MQSRPVARVRQLHIDGFEEKVAKSGFDPYVATWAGRLDLAQKAAASKQYVGPRYFGQTAGRDRPGRDGEEGVDVNQSDDPRRKIGGSFLVLPNSVEFSRTQAPRATCRHFPEQ